MIPNMVNMIENSREQYFLFIFDVQKKEQCTLEDLHDTRSDC
jgi:hypothetical protein